MGLSLPSHPSRSAERPSCHGTSVLATLAGPRREPRLIPALLLPLLLPLLPLLLLLPLLPLLPPLPPLLVLVLLPPLLMLPWTGAVMSAEGFGVVAAAML